MKALFIGGTGTISTAVTELARERGWEVAITQRPFYRCFTFSVILQCCNDIHIISASAGCKSSTAFCACKCKQGVIFRPICKCSRR